MRTARLLTVYHGGAAWGLVGWADPPGHVTCDACWEANPHPPWTNTCENITLPQTSFAGGKNGQNRSKDMSQGPLCANLTKNSDLMCKFDKRIQKRRC